MFEKFNFDIYYNDKFHQICTSGLEDTMFHRILSKMKDDLMSIKLCQIVEISNYITSGLQTNVFVVFVKITSK